MRTDRNGSNAINDPRWKENRIQDHKGVVQGHWNRRPSLIQIDITEKAEKLKGCYILMW